jgi:hypothetical protein
MSEPFKHVEYVNCESFERRFTSRTVRVRLGNPCVEVYLWQLPLTTPESDFGVVQQVVINGFTHDTPHTKRFRVTIEEVPWNEETA